MEQPKVEVKNFEPTNNKTLNSDVAQMIATAVAEALKQAIPAAAVGINAANAQSESKKREVAVREAMAKVQRCPICLLPVSACGGAFAKDKDGNDVVQRDSTGAVLHQPSVNHVRYYCGPRDESLLPWFQGVIVRNVRFLSDYYNHEIWIPKKSDIPTIINNWERNERELSRARKAEGRGMGTVGNGGVQAAPQSTALGWR